MTRATAASAAPAVIFVGMDLDRLLPLVPMRFQLRTRRTVPKRSRSILSLDRRTEIVRQGTLSLWHCSGRADR